MKLSQLMALSLFILISASAKADNTQPDEKKTEAPKEEVKWCDTINMKDYPVKAPVFIAYTETENIGYESVRSLVKQIFEEKEFKLIDKRMKDIKSFCPNYSKFNKEGREEFFGHLLANIARYESHYATGDSMAENNGNISRGLLGISYDSLSSVYKEKGCDVITTDLDLNDGKNNLQCGLAIISRWVDENKVLALDSKNGASRYWSTLRSPYNVCLNLYKKVVTVGFKEVIIEGVKQKMPKCFKK